MTSPDPINAELQDALGSAYELQRELTGGGMSRVFLATERALNRDVVVKVLPPDLAAGVNRERFRREIQVAAQLQHPHIVPLHAAGSHGDLLYFTMPFIQGESLQRALRDGTKFTTRQVLRILHDVVDALAYAHERGVIHRDIKPANVLRSGTHAVVTDFGVAKAISASLPAVGMTTSGMAIGTPAYMAPEQLAGDVKADHRMDIYAVGLLAYELFTGGSPFAESSPAATMAAQLTRDPPELSRQRPDIPEPVSRLIARCLSKDPAKRPQTAAELAEEIDQLILMTGERTTMVPVRKRVGALAIVGAAAATLLIAALLIQRTRTPSTPTPTSAAANPPVVQTPASASSPAATAAAPTGPTAPPAPAPVAPKLSAADSLNIAKALERRMAKQAATAAADSQKRASKKSAATTVSAPPVSPFVDSLARVALLLVSEQRSTLIQAPQENPLSREAIAERAANLGPARTVMILIQGPFPGRSDLDSVATALADRLRRELAAPAARGRFQTVATVPQSLTVADPRVADSLTAAAGADMSLVLMPSPRRDSSVTWNVVLRDLTARDEYRSRSAQRRFARDSATIGLDSLAITVRRGLEQLDRSPRHDAVDPAFRAFTERAANLGPPRRVVVSNHAPDQQPAVQEAGSVLMDAVRHALAGSKRFVPVRRDSTLATLEKTRDRKLVGTMLNSEILISIRGFVERADSIRWNVTVSDATALPAFEQRSVTGPRVPLAAPYTAAASLVAQVLALLEQIDRAPRRSLQRD
jgi:serine/threonine protein kinase